MDEMLLVLGEQAKVVPLINGATRESLKEKFYEHFSGQVNAASRMVLQVWDENWDHWVDTHPGEIETRERSKFRLIKRENEVPRLGNLSPETCAFLCCDMQERFRPAISHFDEITTVANRLLKGASLLDIPLFVTEQYPKGLLKTVEELDISNAKAIIEKTVFSMVVPEMEEKLHKSAPNLQTAILFGVEAHVCIQQTALDLLEQGIEVHIVADACSSRSTVDRILAFERLRRQGAVVTTAETALLQLVKDKNHPKFKEVQTLIKTLPAQNGILNVQSSL